MTKQRTTSRDLLLSVFAGVITAFLFVAIFKGGPIGTFSIYFSSLPLVVVGFSLGCAAAMVSSLSAIAVLSMIGSGPSSPEVFITADVIPCMMIVGLGLLSKKNEKSKWSHSLRVAKDDNDRIWYPIGSILCWLAFASSALLALFALLFTSGMIIKNIQPDTLIEGYITSYLSLIVKQSAIDNPDLKGNILNGIGPILPSLLAMCWIVKSMLVGIVAMWLLNKKKLNLRPVPDYNNLDLPQWHYGVLLLAGAFWLFHNGNLSFAGKNIAIVMALPLMFQGIAFAHRLAGVTKYPKLCLIVFYILFVIGMDFMTAVTVVLGLFEETTKMRRKKTLAESQKEPIE